MFCLSVVWGLFILYGGVEIDLYGGLRSGWILGECVYGDL